MEHEAIYRLWDDLSDFDVSESDKALDLFLKRVCRWIGAENAFWIGAVRVQRGANARRDPMSGWRAGAMHILDPTYIDKQRQKNTLRTINRQDNDPGETSRALARQSGRFRITTLHSGELVDLAPFKSTAHYDRHYRRLGISDRMWIVFPLNPDAEAYYCFDKHGKCRFFNPQDVTLAAHASRGIKWFHRQLHLSHGLGISETPLTPTERRVLQELLSGKTEKHIAGRLGLTPGSAHQYATAIYRKFGIRGRAEFMALWLSHDIPSSKIPTDQ